MKRQHYLVTITTNSGMHLHGYLMTNDKRQLMGLTEKMMQIVEKDEPLRLPIILSTILTTGAPLVRKILRERFEESKQALKTAKNFHASIWATTPGDPDDNRLMELH